MGALGCSCEPVAPPADGAVPAWAKVSQLQIDSACKVGVPVAKELDLGGGISIRLVLIYAGKFMMGEKGDEHEVTITKPFYMGVTEVTQAQYRAIMGTNPSEFWGVTTPVDSVSWDDATEFCKKLSEKTRQAVRLPTEAEWEYACRSRAILAGATAFSFGYSESALCDYAWYDANSGGMWSSVVSPVDLRVGGRAHPVGQKEPNAWGLYDMHGNVWEWCADWYGDYPKGPVTDPQGPASGPCRVLRGGSWIDGPSFCRSAMRLPGILRRGGTYGFRVVSVSAPGP